MYAFHAYGHRNIRASHRTTLEFTKDAHVTIEGDCILGINSDFDPEKLRNFAKDNKDRKAKMMISIDNFQDEVNFELNPEFNDEKEAVIRKTSFISERTFGIRADKAACDIKKEIRDMLKKGAKLDIRVVCH